MVRRKASKKQVSEKQLESLNSILRNDPALYERLFEIAQLSQLPDEKIRKIDDVEGELIEKINHLGQQTLSSFGQAVEEKAVQAMRQEGKSFHQREKKR